MDNLKEIVLGFFASKGEIPGNSEEDKLGFWYLDEGLIDSFGVIEMVNYLEQECQVQFTPELMQSEQFRTIGGLIATIQQLLEENKK